MRSAPSYRALTPAKVLLVDDNRNGIDARCSVLEELGYTVTSASTGAEALKMADSVDFDLIVTDFKMPQMDGVELIAALRERNFRNPVILLTGYADTLGFSKEQTSADMVIQKSSNEIKDLVRAAKRLLTAPRKPAGKQSKTVRVQSKVSNAND